MTSEGRDPQSSTNGPSLGISQGAPRRPPGGALGLATNDYITPAPPQSDLEPLAEIQERLPLLLSMTPPSAQEQEAQLRELTDQVVREAGED